MERDIFRYWQTFQPVGVFSKKRGGLIIISEWAEVFQSCDYRIERRGFFFLLGDYLQQRETCFNPQQPLSCEYSTASTAKSFLNRMGPVFC